MEAKIMPEQENNEEVDDYRKALERDKFIYDNICNRYNLEWDRTKVLDSKSSGIISFVGIILALQGGIGATLINNSPKTGILIFILNEIFILSVICLSISIIYGLKAYYIQTFIFFPKPNRLIESRINNKGELIIFRDLEVTLAHSIDENTQVNDKKAKTIIYGFNFLVAGLLLNLIFIIGLIIATSYLK